MYITSKKMRICLDLSNSNTQIIEYTRAVQRLVQTEQIEERIREIKTISKMDSIFKQGHIMI